MGGCQHLDSFLDNETQCIENQQPSFQKTIEEKSVAFTLQIPFRPFLAF